MQTKFLENEFWYGGAVYESYRQPVGAEDSVVWDFRENPTANQIMPLFLSTREDIYGVRKVSNSVSQRKDSGRGGL